MAAPRSDRAGNPRQGEDDPRYHEPFLKRPDGYGAGLPKDGPQSGIEVAESGRGNGRVELLANRAALGMWCGVGCYLSAVTAGF